MFFFFFYTKVCRKSFFFFFSSRRRHTRLTCDWSSDVCSSDLDPDLCGAEKRGQAHLAEVKPHGGENVEIAIDVMHEMKSPKRLRDVIQPVPPPQGVIEQQDAGDEANRARQRNAMQQAESPLRRRSKDRLDERLLQRRGDDGSQSRHREIASHPPP